MPNALIAAIRNEKNLSLKDVQNFLNEGIDVNEVDLKIKETALTLAVTNGLTMTVANLAKIDGIDPNFINHTGYTALMIACAMGQKEMVEAILRIKDVDIFVETKYQETALNLAKSGRDGSEVWHLMRQAIQQEQLDRQKKAAAIMAYKNNEMESFNQIMLSYLDNKMDKRIYDNAQQFILDSKFDLKFFNKENLIILAATPPNEEFGDRVIEELKTRLGPVSGLENIAGKITDAEFEEDEKKGEALLSGIIIGKHIHLFTSCKNCNKNINITPLSKRVLKISQSG